MDDLAARLRDAGAQLLALRGQLVAAEPWPLSAAYGTEPEADWGPREVLAHVNEMLPYWGTQLRLIVAGDPTDATPFGRVSTDPDRIGRIGADRKMSCSDLLDRIGAGLANVDNILAGLSAADLARRGVHSTRGELTVGEAADRFLVTHVVEHVEQLRAILVRRSAIV